MIASKSEAEHVGDTLADAVLEALPDLETLKTPSLAACAKTVLLQLRQYPPEEVADAFRDVSNARQDKEKRINNALGFRNTIIPRARGDAEKSLREGEAYKIDVINRSRGEAANFDQMLAEYERNKKIYSADVTRYRLYLESMEKVLSRVKKYMVNTANGGKVNLRLLEGE